MRLRSFTIILVLLGCLCGTQGFALPQSGSIASYNSPIYTDFDSDNKVDQAELASDGRVKQVFLTFGKSSTKSLSFDSGVVERGQLLSGDVDNDGDADLVWISQSYPQKLVMWLGDGRGNFARASETDPATNTLPTSLGQAHTSTIHSAIGIEISAVPSASWLLNAPRSTIRKPYFVPSTRPLPAPPASVARDPFLSVLQQRGPPSQFS